MRQVFVFLAAATCLSSSFAAEREAVSAAQASQNVNTVTTVFGKVIEVRRVANGPVIFEIEGRPSAPAFRALVYPMAVPRFGSDPENVYLGKIVEVTGPIVIRKDLPQVWINDPSEIRLRKIETPAPAAIP